MRAKTVAMANAETFEQHRKHVFGVAYRMLGSVADAEDVVQDTWLRFAPAAPDNPRAWLTTVATRLSIDRLRELKSRREEYAGPWLPEPMFTQYHESADQNGMLAESLTLAFLAMLERLNETERAVLLLREVFNYEYSEIATIVERSEANCRQIFSRAKERLGRPPRYEPDARVTQDLLSRLIAALQSGDAKRLVTLLSDDVVLVSDGGGKVSAALRPLRGTDNVSRFLLGISRQAPPNSRVEFREINGQPAMLLFGNGSLIAVGALKIENGKITGLNFVRNPEKLAHLSL